MMGALKGDLFPGWKPQPSPPQRTGHAWAPGTGPKGETCKSCKHFVRRHFGKVFRKCGLMQQQWTNSYGTDIRASDPACLKWEKP